MKQKVEFNGKTYITTPELVPNNCKGCVFSSHGTLCTDFRVKLGIDSSDFCLDTGTVWKEYKEPTPEDSFTIGRENLRQFKISMSIKYRIKDDMISKCYEGTKVDAIKALRAAVDERSELHKAIKLVRESGYDVVQGDSGEVASNHVMSLKEAKRFVEVVRMLSI